MYTIYTPSKILTTESESEFNDFCASFEQVEAGGGLVRNAAGEYLLIRRKEMWDLPKGKREEGESIESCALREVEEETGLHNLKCGKLICTTHHTYDIYGPATIKHTYWFEMEYDGTETPVPQTEEEITEVIWADRKKALELMSESYLSIAEVVRTALL